MPHLALLRHAGRAFALFAVVVAAQVGDPAVGGQPAPPVVPSTGGRRDLDFGAGGQARTDFGGRDQAEAMAVLPDGRIVLGGFTIGETAQRVALARYLPDGRIDQSFGVGGRVALQLGETASAVHALVLQPGGEIVAAGFAGQFASDRQDFLLARFTADGALDAGFGQGGSVRAGVGGNAAAHAVGLLPDGRVVVAGVAGGGERGPALAVARYLPSGLPDETFGRGGAVTVAPPGVSAAGRALVVLPDGGVIVGGSPLPRPPLPGAPAPAPAPAFVLARLTVDGELDDAFGDGGIVLTASGACGGELGGLTLLPDGSVLAAGTGHVPDGADCGGPVRFRPALARFGQDGRPASDFGQGGVVFRPDFGAGAVSAVAVQSDGGIITAGLVLGRYRENGALDADFGPGGSVTPFGPGATARAVAIDAAGHILVAGFTTGELQTEWDFVLARVLNDPGP